MYTLQNSLEKSVKKPLQSQQATKSLRRGKNLISRISILYYLKIFHFNKTIMKHEKNEESMASLQGILTETVPEEAQTIDLLER